MKKERQKKIKDLEEQIKALVDKIELCKSPTVITELKQRVEVLRAKKLRLGEKVSAPKEVA